MKEDGITLIELIVVITIIGILAVALGFSFQGWIGGYRVESQVKEMYVDLMNARARAMQRNRLHFVVVNAGDYQVYEDTDDDSAIPPPIDAGDTRILRPDPKPFHPNYQSLWANTVTMDTRGLVSPNGTIRFNIGSSVPDYDCIVLFPTRINIGRWEECDASSAGNECCAR
jgi:prepilin-type N-terminal cleavage/methylation domain-containing protein